MSHEVGDLSDLSSSGWQMSSAAQGTRLPMSLLKILVLTIIIFAGLCKPSFAELYRFTDAEGNIHITDNLDAVPVAQQPRTHPAEARVDQRPLENAKKPSEPAEASKKEPRTAAVSSPLPSTLPQQKDGGLNIIVQSAVSAIPSGAASKLPPEYRDQFKDVMQSSSIPPEGSTASCNEFKSGLNQDMDKILQTIRELAAEKKKGELGILAKAKGIWTLRSVGWVVYRMMNGQEQCVKEYQKENEARFTAMTKEIDGLTAEVKDK
jgi:hypothetical protein